MNPLHTAELAEKIKAKDSVHLLDIRQEADVQDWSIDVDSVKQMIFHLPLSKQTQIRLVKNCQNMTRL